MRRSMTIAAFALFLFLALLTVPVWAQHGGGHGGGGGHASFGGGGHAGFSGGHAGGFSGRSGYSGVHAYSGARSGVGSARGFNSSRGFSRSFSPPVNRGLNRGPFLHNGHSEIGLGNGIGFRGGFGFRNGVRLRGYGFRNSCYGFGYGCWGWGWGYYPWWTDDSAYDDDYYQNLGIANQMNQQSLEEQQIRRQEEADGDQDGYVRPPRRMPSELADERASDAVVPATVLVFRDQHKQEVHNYAIVGPTLWSFSSQRTEKIALADLDLTATTKVNEERGVTFRVPAAPNPNAPPVNLQQPMQGQPATPAPNSSTV